MNRGELIDAVAGKADLSKADAERAVGAVFASIAESLSGGEDVRLIGFGTFVATKRAASEGRNPRTGEPIQIAASRSAKFKAGKALRAELNPPPARSQGRRVAVTRAGPTRARPVARVLP